MSNVPTESMRPRNPVITDVARLAGVSHQTVSRVLNDHPSVRDETRARVNEAIAQLGYRPNRAARALVTRRTGTIGVLSARVDQHGPRSILLGVEQAARDAGYSIMIASIVDDSATVMMKQIEAAKGQLIDQGVEGIVGIASLTRTNMAIESKRDSVPMIITGDAEVGAVAVDQRAGAAAATRHLLELGHESVVHLAGPRDWFDAEARVEGWRDELNRAKTVILDPVSGDWGPASGYRAAQWVIDTGATAVFAANDQMALGLILGLTELGVSVPKDISIVGFDDIPEAAFFRPPLTTVRQDFALLGRQCVDVLLHEVQVAAGERRGQLVGSIQGAPAPEQVLIRPELMVRASSSAPGKASKRPR